MDPITKKSLILSEVCQALAKADEDKARQTLRTQYPFAPETFTRRQYGPEQATSVFLRDGFIDRYTGAKLIYPPVIRVLSHASKKTSPSIPTGRPT